MTRTYARLRLTVVSSFRLLSKAVWIRWIQQLITGRWCCPCMRPSDFFPKQDCKDSKAWGQARSLTKCSQNKHCRSSSLPLLLALPCRTLRSMA
jgi:hypothetical protein